VPVSGQLHDSCDDGFPAGEEACANSCRTNLSPNARGISPWSGPWTAGHAASFARRDGAQPTRQRGIDAQGNVASLLEAAKTVFAASGVNAPAKEIADLAGVGVGTLYRHFPQRSDLVKAVLQHEIDACADAATALGAAHEPGVALAKWLRRYTEFLAAKKGFAAALHSGDPAFDALPGYFYQRLEPALGSLRPPELVATSAVAAW